MKELAGFLCLAVAIIAGLGISCVVVCSNRRQGRASLFGLWSGHRQMIVAGSFNRSETLLCGGFAALFVIFIGLAFFFLSFRVPA